LKDGKMTMATLEAFMKSGHLGPLVLGSSPNDVMAVLGEPDGISRKSNPLLLKYGCVQLTFWKPRDGKHELREITVDFQNVSEPAPSSLEFADWNLTEPPTERRFRNFMRQINYLPFQSPEGATSRELIFASGVTARFRDEMLVSIRLTERENKASIPVDLTDEREPTLEQISDMFDEADRAVEAGAKRAALLIAWAGLEATLRRLAVHAGRKGSVGTQPIVLLRELFSEGRLTSTDQVIVEHFRQLRMSAAHGLTPVAFPADTVSHIKAISKRLLAGATEIPDHQHAIGVD
jgi:hypothetical protein